MIRFFIFANCDDIDPSQEFCHRIRELLDLELLRNTFAFLSSVRS